MLVPFLDPGAQWRELEPELSTALARVGARGVYLHGPELEAFEAEFAAWCGAARCAAVGSGLDALRLALVAAGVGPGDEVIVPAHTFIATWLAVTEAGARPVGADVDPATGLVDPADVAARVGPRTRAIIPVHLYGRVAPMVALRAIADRHGLFLLEDAAQAHGASLGVRRAGTLAHAAAFSFYPGKNLGALGDGGAVVTADAALDRRVRMLRNYGAERKYVHEVRGVNSRLDELQASVLRVKLRQLDAWNARRRLVASVYEAALRGGPVTPPESPRDGAHAWHLYVVRTPERDALAQHLAAAGVQTLVHYPVPPHLSGAYRDLGLRRGAFPVTERLCDEVLSLPIGPHLDAAQAAAVAAQVNAFRPRRRAAERLRAAP
jgi:dTDP-4-amino-4,6-dideoxygalactose transaminase